MLMPPGSHPSIGWLMPSVLAFCLVLAGILHVLAAKIGHQSHAPASPLVPNNNSSRIAQDDTFGDVVIPTSTVSITTQQEVTSSFPGTVTLHTFKIPVGNFQDFGDTKIEVREVRKHVSRYPAEGQYGAVLRVNPGGGLIFGGEKTKKISINCYCLPTGPLEGCKEPYSLYCYSFTESYASWLIAYIEHINPHTGIVTIKTCEAWAHKSSPDPPVDSN
jgi:hypothetical protein